MTMLVYGAQVLCWHKFCQIASGEQYYSIKQIFYSLEIYEKTFRPPICLSPPLVYFSLFARCNRMLVVSKFWRSVFFFLSIRWRLYQRL